MNTAEMISTAEVAARANVSRRTVARWVAAGKLVPVFKIPGKTGALLFDPADVDALEDGPR